MTPEQESRLLEWYQVVKRDLPWRRSRELYPVLVSELMLQQTTVAAVVPLYQRWMQRFPTAEHLAEATSDQVMEAWSGLGYYNRARNLHRTAALLRDRAQSPASLEELRQLPGLGPYTAAAVASIALGLPHLALDTNALRVLLRLYGWQTRADLPSVQETLRQRVESSLPGSDFGITNQAIMELGATLCKVRAPACLACPLGQDCQARAQAIEERIPTPKPRKAPQLASVVAYLLASGEQVLLVRGTPVGLLGDLFQPPMDFGDENRNGLPLSELLQWMRSRSGRPSRDRVGYGISGRRLSVELVEMDEPGAVMARARELGVEAHLWAEDSRLALSSLTRKILKVWRETRADSPRPDGRCSASEPGQPASRC